MAWYKKGGRYYFIGEDAQIIEQMAKADAEIKSKNENENEAENESSQGDSQVSFPENRVSSINVNGTGTFGQSITVTQTTGADINTANPVQSNSQTNDDTAIAAAVPLNFGDQTINE